VRKHSVVTKGILTSALGLMTLFSSQLLAKEDLPKASMKSNSQISYNQLPGEANDIAGMFQEGQFYGRLRSNNFYFWWDGQDTVNNDIHFISGMGGSIAYKSATLSGFDFSGALYYSYAFLREKEDFLSGWKAGKDAVSRLDLVKTGDKSMSVLGQAYLRYSFAESEIIAGRQLVETFYTKSNDTKMIPNTFDGLVFKSSDIPETGITLAYLTKQKLRDHTQNHSLLMYGDCNSTHCSDPSDLTEQATAIWTQNDDSAMHRGLTYTALKAAGVATDAPLITGDFRNTSIENLQVDASFYVVPELLSQAMGELNYTFDLGALSITPGIRYIKQFDNGAGAIGGASYKGGVSSTNPNGYKDPDSLDAQMVAARLVARFSDYKINLAYTYILDEADLVTPWRGFPTAGYTRSMARYNWRANTKSYRLEVVRSTSSIGLYNDLFVQASILYQDEDAQKRSGIDFDSLYYYLGLMQNISFLDNAQWRYRLGYQDYRDPEASGINNIDTRFEINYFF